MVPRTTPRSREPVRRQGRNPRCAFRGRRGRRPSATTKRGRLLRRCSPGAAAVATPLPHASRRTRPRSSSSRCCFLWTAAAAGVGEELECAGSRSSALAGLLERRRARGCRDPVPRGRVRIRAAPKRAAIGSLLLLAAGRLLSVTAARCWTAVVGDCCSLLTAVGSRRSSLASRRRFHGPGCPTRPRRAAPHARPRPRARSRPRPHRPPPPTPGATPSTTSWTATTLR